MYRDQPFKCTAFLCLFNSTNNHKRQQNLFFYLQSGCRGEEEERAREEKGGVSQQQTANGAVQKGNLHNFSPIKTQINTLIQKRNKQTNKTSTTPRHFSCRFSFQICQMCQAEFGRFLIKLKYTTSWFTTMRLD